MKTIACAVLAAAAVIASISCGGQPLNGQPRTCQEIADHPEWFDCTVDDDCQGIPDCSTCGVIAVSKQSATAAQDAVRCQSCVAQSCEPKMPPAIMCDSGRCTTREPEVATPL